MTYSFASRPVWLLVLIISTVLITELLTPCSGAESFVVYIGGHDHAVHSEGRKLLSTIHHEKLTDLLGSSESAKDSLIYSYKNFNAFAAKLTADQAATLLGHEDVLSVFPNKGNHLHTTRSWNFLGLEDGFGNVPPSSLWNKSNYGKNVVIGLLDTGLWPESESFNDTGFDPIPPSWKGECEVGDRFGPTYCNKKLIGGRSFIKGFLAATGATSVGSFLSARDSEGHGTHTSSTAGGNFVPNASSLGFGLGTAKGGAPLARIAMYKVCWPTTEGGCFDADILAAFDQGISDGVDVFSFSIGKDPPLNDFFADGIAIGAFHAVQHNIPVIASAGNAGPGVGTVTNVPPWIITVGASSIDRDFVSPTFLGNDATFEGTSLTIESDPAFYPLVLGEQVSNISSNATNAQLCLNGSLDHLKTSGKIVACSVGVSINAAKGEEVRAAGGLGMIVINDDYSISSFNVLPTSQIRTNDTIALLSYLNSTTTPLARVPSATTVFGDRPSPVIPTFSSIGPNSLIPDLLKPDLSAPGFNILAAYSQAVSVTGLPDDPRILPYSILSGTSMACPHVSGTAASLKAYHPTWTPAAIHSALVTTASVPEDLKTRVLFGSNYDTDAFTYGAGNLNPNAAAEPGLVYDNAPGDYFPFLCSLGYSNDSIRAISGSNFTCSASNNITVSDFNYPSLTVSNLVNNRTVKRSVTNVGYATSTYVVTIDSPPGIDTQIIPPKLKFSALGEIQSFSVVLTDIIGTPSQVPFGSPYPGRSDVQFTQGNYTPGQYSFGSFTWSDGVHFVRSPLVVRVEVD